MTSTGGHMNEIGFRIALIKNGLSQNRLANRVGLCPQVLSTMVRGYRSFPADLINRICAVLGVSQKELFEDSQKETAA